MTGKLNVALVAIGAALVVALPGTARAQELTAEDVQRDFVVGVELCVRATMQGVEIGALPEATRLTPADPMARRMQRVPEGRPAWAVNGIVTITEPEPHKCEVMAYGPRVRPTFAVVGQRLKSRELGFSEVDVPDTDFSIYSQFERSREGSSDVTVLLDGGEPGMPGRTFRFPMLNATVSSAGAP